VAMKKFKKATKQNAKIRKKVAKTIQKATKQNRQNKSQK